MLTLRHRDERGHTRINWLNSYHTFSFGDYYDPGHMGFSDLRVINDDRVQPGAGFSTHGHRDMEIITYVLEGALEHKDSMGTGSIINAGDVQRMTAGTGVTHSEYNHSKTEPVHLLQIWILPEAENIKPGYEQRSFPPEELQNTFRLIASRDGRNGSLTIHQDAELYLSTVGSEEQLTYAILPNRQVWLHVATGVVELDNQMFEAGDGIGITEEKQIALKGIDTQSNVLLFNMRRY